MDDPYHYARDHDRGPGAWCVLGPNGFRYYRENLQKSEAYVIGKILSGSKEDFTSNGFVTRDRLLALGREIADMSEVSED